VPRTEPRMKPRTVSSMVTSTCSQSGPSAVPSVIQTQSRSTISEGWEKKNLSTHPSRVVSSQLPSQTTAKTTRRTLTVQRRRRASRARFAARSVTGLTAGPVVAAMAALGRAAALLTLIAHQDLVAEVVPDLFVDLGKARLEADLGDVARPGQVDLVAALDRSRPGGDHVDAVAEGDRLLQVVGDEDDRGGARGPEAQELVLHQGAGLHVERAEGLIHEQDPRLVDQALGEGHPLAHAPGKLVRVAVLEARQADAGDPVASPLARLLARSPQVARAGGDVLQHRLPGKDGVGLEDIADALGDAVDGLPEHLDLAFAGRLQAGDQRERRRLPTAGRSHDGAELAGCDREVEIVEGGVDAA